MRLPDGRIPSPTWILVVEDNEANALLAVRQLEKLGYAATVVGDGHEANEALERTNYALILMDLNMPGMDGLEAARRIRRTEKGSSRHVPIVAMTASVTAHDRQACLAAGMDDFLSKPVLLETLRSVLVRWLPTRSEGTPPVAPPCVPAVSPGDVTAERSHDRASVEAPLDPSVLARLREELGAQAFSRFLAIYLSELVGRVGAIRSAAETGDPESLRQAAHALKSPSAAVGASGLAALCAELEAPAEEAVSRARTRLPALAALGADTARALEAAAEEFG